MHHLTRRLALAALGMLALLAPASASATSTPEQIATATSGGVTYLKSQQLKDGSISGFGGDWALTAFAAAGVASANVKLNAESTDARTWFQGLIGSPTWPGGANPPATEFERAALVAYAAGIDPARVSKRQNMIGRIASYYQPSEPGYYGSSFNGTIFALLALAATKTQGGLQRVPQVVLNQSIAAVRENQHTDGGWTFEKAAGNAEALAAPSEPDTTGAAMAALCTAGVAPSDEAIGAARTYLASLLVNATGAIESEFGPNTDSTGWAVQGLKACGFDPQEATFTTEAGKTPVDFLISQQLAEGGFKSTTSEKTANVYSTANAVRAFAGSNFTATPPVPTGGLPQWKAETEFGLKSTETVPLALIVDDGSSELKVCAVTVAPKAATTTLSFVLNAAVAGTTPASCVTGFLPTSGTGAITQVNGFPKTPEERWFVSIDGGEEKQAKRGTEVRIGDTIYLRFK
jgi:hypothetical protein